MGLFGNLFQKTSCAFCGKEVGALGRTKIKGDEYICSDCTKQCSQYIRLSEYDKEHILEHIDYMKKMDAISQAHAGDKWNIYPSNPTAQGIAFNDSIGMFRIIDKTSGTHKMYTELFRYDQVESYEPYVKYGKDKDSGKDTVFEEYGIKITLVNAQSFSRISEEKGYVAHPYIKQPITLSFSKRESDYSRADYSKNVVQHFDVIFGVHDNQTALFSLKGSKNQQREAAAVKDMSKLMGMAIKGAVKGADSLNADDVQLQMQKAQSSTAAAETHGLSVYTERADAAENEA